MDKKYNEYKVIGSVVNGEFKIDKKELTKRGHVMISERDASINNQQTRFTYLHYELSDVSDIIKIKPPSDKVSPERAELEKEANELGVKFSARIGDAKLIEKINEAKK